MLGSISDYPWQCNWIPFYAQANPSSCQKFNTPTASQITAATVPTPPTGDTTGVATYAIDQQSTIPAVSSVWAENLNYVAPVNLLPNSLLPSLDIPWNTYLVVGLAVVGILLVGGKRR